MVSRVTVASGGHVVSLNDFLCNQEFCPAVVDNVLVYRDQHHLTTSFARHVSSEVGAAIARN